MIADKSLLLNESSMVDMQQLGLNGSKTSTSGAAAVRATLKNFSGASNQYAKLDDSQVVEEITGDSTGGSSTTTDEDNEPSLAKKCSKTMCFLHCFNHSLTLLLLLLQAYILVIIFSIICVGELPNIFGTQNPTSTTSRSSAGLTKSNSTSSTTSTATTTVAPLPFFTPASYNSSLGTGTWIDLCQSSLQGKVFCDSTLKDAIISFPNTTINVTNCQFNNCPGIVANSPMNFTNVSFIGSSSMGLSLPSSKYAGGGAFRTSSFATFNSCIFSGCTVMNMMSNAMYGGAVYADAGSNVTMVNCCKV